MPARAAITRPWTHLGGWWRAALQRLAEKPPTPPNGFLFILDNTPRTIDTFFAPLEPLGTYGRIDRRQGQGARRATDEGRDAVTGLMKPDRTHRR